MKKIGTVLCALIMAGLLGGCASLKPFTQDELDRLSAVAGTEAVA